MGGNFSPSHIQSSTPIILWKPKKFSYPTTTFWCRKQNPGAADSKCWELNWDGAGAAKSPETGKPSCLIQRDFPWEFKGDPSEMLSPCRAESCPSPGHPEAAQTHPGEPGICILSCPVSWGLLMLTQTPQPPVLGHSRCLSMVILGCSV